ncbi:hypothetical protein [Pedobacter nanyangensis]|uniref:hypothetical protein n=1 Tax=Pedobacter nanyangensis TaxID=1562389 RepID=UPI001F06EDD6|nr:hypothetical protein [Pedobacter nanyangensis]
MYCFKKYSLLYLSALLINIGAFSSVKAQRYSFDFYEGTFNFQVDTLLQRNFTGELSAKHIQQYYQQLERAHSSDLIAALQNYRKQYQLNDWLYYQLIRKTAEQLSPKAKNYPSYTLYKWYLMVKSGYDARLAIGDNQIIFYVKCDEDISDIPYFMIDGNKYMCLNYHDYQKLFKKADTYIPVKIDVAEAKNDFSYKVTKMPDFKPEDYQEKQIAFNYKHKAYHFNVKVNTEVSRIFANYPVVDFETYFNIPLSRETYQSLIPILKENVKKMSTKKGVDYLMQFTRYAFLYEDDEALLGKEKRFSPEQTLLNDQSDCDDRAALFFFLVKEIYNLPMIALLYPTHITMAVAFDKPVGEAIYYNGKAYSVCEPTPQKKNLKVGEIADDLKKQQYEVVYAYQPHSR